MTEIIVKKENVLKAIENIKSEDGFYNKKAHPTNYGLASMLEDLFPEAFEEEKKESDLLGLFVGVLMEEITPNEGYEKAKILAKKKVDEVGLDEAEQCITNDKLEKM